MTRCARERRVFFFEEPLFDAPSDPFLETDTDRGVVVATPHLPPSTTADQAIVMQRALLDRLRLGQRLTSYLLWYYTPMALAFSDHLQPRVTVYDCMDELSAFANAPHTLKDSEAALLRRADVVFTGGQSLYEAKRGAHPNVHAFPSSVDVAHFWQARQVAADPDDQLAIPGPRLGFFGVIDERMDLDLLAGVAAERPDWHLVMLGPIVKIDPASLPRLSNIHYLGSKTYEELPRYIAGWDVALLPFAINDATRFISPTKTPEYLAAGKPVVSTPIRDVVRPYGERGLVRIAGTVEEFIAACAAAMNEDVSLRIRRADRLLTQTSWDATWARMLQLIQDVQTPAVRLAPAAMSSAAAATQ